jgi:hypothetical protein
VESKKILRIWPASPLAAFYIVLSNFHTLCLTSAVHIITIKIVY